METTRRGGKDYAVGGARGGKKGKKTGKTNLFTHRRGCVRIKAGTVPPRMWKKPPKQRAGKAVTTTSKTCQKTKKSRQDRRSGGPLPLVQSAWRKGLYKTRGRGWGKGTARGEFTKLCIKKRRIDQKKKTGHVFWTTNGQNSIGVCEELETADQTGGKRGKGTTGGLG